MNNKKIKKIYDKYENQTRVPGLRIRIRNEVKIQEL
jgi:hypothetical protein